jgi:hypothetical protein
VAERAETAGKEPDETRGRAQEPAAAGEGDWQARFLRILGNRDDPSQSAWRDLGFAVVARNARTLHAVQELCVDPRRQTHNTCLTARYRLRSGPVFGTLLAAFASDLIALDPGFETDQAFNGDLLPDPRQQEGPWQQLFESGELASLLSPSSLRLTSRGSLEASWPWTFMEAFNEEVVLPTDHRLVLLCEIEGTAGTLDEWERAQALLRRLPERVGLVFSNIPEGFAFPQDDPHFLEISLPVMPAPTGESVLRFVPASLSGDKPADQDILGRARYSEAFARLVMLDQTRPLAIGVHAPWGKGKSSFMNLVGQALVRVAAERSSTKPVARMVGRLGKLEESIREVEGQLVAPPRGGPGSYEGQGAEGPTVQSVDVAERAARERDREFLTKRADLEADRQAHFLKLERAVSDSVVRVPFNAWLYQDSTLLWAGLVREATRRVEEALPRRARSWVPFAYALRKRRKELLVGLVLPVALATLLVGAAVFLGITNALEEATRGVPELGDVLQFLLPASSVALSVWLLGRKAFQVVQPVSQRILEYMRLPGSEEDIGHQAQVIEDLAFLRERLTRSRWRWIRGRPRRVRADPRIVVFIDDLDRCPNDKVMEVLQTINLIFGASDFFVFLAIDTEKIYQAIEERYPGMSGQEDSELTLPEQYLRKILQLSFHLPETQSDQRILLVHEMFSPEARREFRERQEGQAGKGEVELHERVLREEFLDYDLTRLIEPKTPHLKDVEDTSEELATFDKFKAFVPDNPREIKRLVNVHRLVKILLQRPEAPPNEVDQRKLVQWLIFCARWPGLVDDVLVSTRSAAPQSSVIKVLVEDLLSEQLKVELGSFKRTVDEEDTLRSEELVPGTVLAEAARISQMIREQPSGLKKPEQN